MTTALTAFAPPETVNAVVIERAATGSPIRVQRRRVKGWRKPENTVCVDRTTKWGNPFKADWPEGGKDRAWATSAFRGYYHADPEYRAAVVRELRGKNLACFCSTDGPCHADVLLEWANGKLIDRRGEERES